MRKQALKLLGAVYGGANFKSVIRSIKFLKGNVANQSLIPGFFHQPYITIHVF